MTLRRPRRCGAWVGATLATGVLTSAVLAAGPPAGARSGLPPVVELGEAPVSAAREMQADLPLQMEALQTELRQLRGQMPFVILPAISITTPSLLLAMAPSG